MTIANQRFRCNARTWEAGDQLPADVAEFAIGRGYASQPVKTPKLKTRPKLTKKDVNHD